MKKTQKNTILLTPVRPTERKFIFNSLMASFRLEGIFIPEGKAEVIFERVNARLKK